MNKYLNCVIYCTHILKISLLLISCMMLTKCVSTGGYSQGGESKPKNINNVCKILQEKQHWQAPLSRTARKWNTSIDTIMAIIYQESSFNSTARPKPLPGGYKPASSAYGYSQALNGTWKNYKRNTKQTNVRRDSFADSIDFIGWYISVSRKKNKIAKHRADQIYLSYHEGWGGYNRKTYRAKPWLMKTAKKVLARQKNYGKQLRNCNLKHANTNTAPATNNNNYNSPNTNYNNNLKWF